MATLKL